MSPQRANLVLAAHVPDIELCVLVRHRLDVEADRRDRRHVLVELELVQDSCARVVSNQGPIALLPYNNSPYSLLS